MTDGQRLALDLARDLKPTASNIFRLASQFTPEVARWAFQQCALRDRGKAKFRLAEEMLFDQDGLEMATGEILAAYHASRFPAEQLVVDIGSGIGADLIALALRGKTIGFEIDPDRADMTRHNLTVHGGSAEVFATDGLIADWRADFAFCDPARRGGGRRTLKIEEFSPDPRIVAERLSALSLGAIKLSPVLADKDLENFGGSVEFVSYGGECREAIVWLGKDKPESPRFATHVESGESISSGHDPASVDSPMRFIFEADPAAIRAHCLGALCSRYDLCSLGDSNGYLTGESLLNSPWLRAYEVLASHNADLKRTILEMKRLGGGTPVVKARGAQVEVEALRKQLRGQGETLVLIVYPVGRSLKHAICRCA